MTTATAAHLTDNCGHHCLIRANAEGTLIRESHCGCPECHPDGAAPPGSIQATGDAPVITLDLPRGRPMCDRWYSRAGDYRPWERTAHPGSHDIEAARRELLEQLTP